MRTLRIKGEILRVNIKTSNPHVLMVRIVGQCFKVRIHSGPFAFAYFDFSISDAKLEVRVVFVVCYGIPRLKCRKPRQMADPK